MWKSVSPLYRDRGCILRSGARRRRHVTNKKKGAACGPLVASAVVSAFCVVRSLNESELN